MIKYIGGACKVSKSVGDPMGTCLITYFGYHNDDCCGGFCAVVA